MSQSESEPASTTLTATCQCKNFNIPLIYSNNTLPLQRSLCLCADCRRISGTSGGISYIPLPPDVQPVVTHLAAYRSSARITRYFCPQCGAHVLAFVHDIGQWRVSTGILDRTEGVVMWLGCKFVEGTRDGGIGVWMKEIADADGKRRELEHVLGQDGPGAQVVDANWRPSPVKRNTDGAWENDRLRAECHCGGVRFYITRPTAESRKAKSTYSDLIVPISTGPAENPKNEPWFLRDNESKYLAGTCACESCRRNLGFEVQTWAFIPRVNVVDASGQPIAPGAVFGTLTRYRSKDNVERSFCSVCGATVFWNGDWRLDVVDVSTGLFDEVEGARCEGWLDWWTGRVSFKEDAVSTDLIECLENGLKKWGEEQRQ
ncbi:hypothetical protein BP6252_09204 [Coleophoma cylindrospora]|uniref:CENP-V/GFA domain-containing protein n=1 Tax=Coleophoma cylindrospora TaxID=1849047 RepID=A0A3D8R1H4_9HELO|nr:hypothetical protein BP6252_09204 [Coleophoma cylindrospora]